MMVQVAVMRTMEKAQLPRPRVTGSEKGCLSDEAIEIIDHPWLHQAERTSVACLKLGKVPIGSRSDFRGLGARREPANTVRAVLFFGIAGFALQRIVPTADSIGPVIESLLSRAG